MADAVLSAVLSAVFMRASRGFFFAFVFRLGWVEPRSSDGLIKRGRSCDDNAVRNRLHLIHFIFNFNFNWILLSIATFSYMNCDGIPQEPSRTLLFLLAVSPCSVSIALIILSPPGSVSKNPTRTTHRSVPSSIRGIVSFVQQKPLKKLCHIVVRGLKVTKAAS
jgi:hypothetical protein